MIKATIYSEKHQTKSLARRVIEQYQISEPKIDNKEDTLIITGICANFGLKTAEIHIKESG